VDVYEITEDDDHVYIVMEHCANGNLHEHLVANGAVTQEQARLWIGQVGFYLLGLENSRSG
jgi:serine/threonine protein kinase